jgi:hypothetical protein
MRLVTEGRNRFVLVTSRYAFKAPSLRSWRDFLFGLLNNLNEAAWHREHTGYCPVAWAAPLGLLLVMPRAQVLDEAEYAYIESFLPQLPGVERKASSWGWLNGEPVAVDYGWR